MIKLLSLLLTIESQADPQHKLTCIERAQDNYEICLLTSVDPKFENYSGLSRFCKFLYEEAKNRCKN